MSMVTAFGCTVGVGLSHRPPGCTPQAAGHGTTKCHRGGPSSGNTFSFVVCWRGAFSAACRDGEPAGSLMSMATLGHLLCCLSQATWTAGPAWPGLQTEKFQVSSSLCPWRKRAIFAGNRDLFTPARWTLVSTVFSRK